MSVKILKLTERDLCRSTRALFAYYREYGESAALADVEDSLDESWEPTKVIAMRSGRSFNHTQRALEYLTVEGRAECGEGRTRRRRGGMKWRYYWRRKRDCA